MDVFQAIQELTEERNRLDAIIAALEASLTSGRAKKGSTAASRRGRKTMSADERRQVSLRMRSYWAQRRAGASS